MCYQGELTIPYQKLSNIQSYNVARRSFHPSFPNERNFLIRRHTLR
jgi:hypothetical protein